MILVLKIGIRFRNFVRLRGEAIVARGSRTDITRPPPPPPRTNFIFRYPRDINRATGIKATIKFYLG